MRRPRNHYKASSASMFQHPLVAFTEPALCGVRNWRGVTDKLKDVDCLKCRAAFERAKQEAAAR